ncbi:MAG: arylamine N-acetyltransferase [Acidobacteriia bacterium]|nr:arylamine N-acetyltransferase [Terriglobia bacterium]
MNLDAYLRRISYSGPLAPTLETLRALHYAHLLAVPFENLDIHRGVPIALDQQHLFDKIVLRRRGGFCYELNSLFAALLSHLDFQVTLFSARVPIQENRVGPEFDHLTLRVDLDTPWLADVGFGESFIEPLPLLPNAEQFQRDVFYCLDTRDDRWRVLRYSPEPGNRRGVAVLTDAACEWRMLYDFTLQPQRISDFYAMCRHHQTSPESHFTRNRVCSILTPTGRVTLTGARLVITEGATRREIAVATSEEYDTALQQYFGIRLDTAQTTAV